MKAFLRRCACVVFAAIIFSGFAACAKTPSAAQDAKKEELARQFMTDLHDNILAIKNSAVLLAEIGVMVSERERVADMTLFENFAKELDEGKDTALTVAVVAESYVVLRLHYLDGVGYYFRYEYSDETPIAVDSRVFDSWQISYGKEQGGATLLLSYDDKEIDALTFLYA